MDLVVVTEGRTEEAFTRHVLGPHLRGFGLNVHAVSVRTGVRRGRTFRGGMPGYAKVRNEIERTLKEWSGTNRRVTTMFDLYQLSNDFPAWEGTKILSDPRRRVEALEAALGQDISDRRFLPYIQLHEFETLIFVDPSVLALEYFGHDDQIAELIELTGSIEPELINDGQDTAPSKRILQAIPEYSKRFGAEELVRIIGLDRIRDRCPHFSSWLTCLEKLATGT